MKIETTPKTGNVGQYFQRDEFAQIIKIVDGRFIASVNDQTLVDINARSITDEETNEETQFVWYVRLQVFPTFETKQPTTTKPQCTCPPTTETHSENCVYYAPSPKQIYKQFLEDMLS